MIAALRTLGLVALVVASGLWPVSAGAASRTEIKRLVVEEAQRAQVPTALALAVAKVESDFQEQALSEKGARGVMQIMPETARDEYGVAADRLWDPRVNVRLGLDYLARLNRQYGGRWELALSHYNGGTLAGTGARARPHSYTRDYVAKVLRWRQRYEDQRTVWLADTGRGQGGDFDAGRERDQDARITWYTLDDFERPHRWRRPADDRRDHWPYPGRRTRPLAAIDEDYLVAPPPAARQMGARSVPRLGRLARPLPTPPWDQGPVVHWRD